MAPEQDNSQFPDAGAGRSAIPLRALAVAAAAIVIGLAAWALLSRTQPPPPPPPDTSLATAARFVTIEGSVKVKPVGEFEWVDATPSLLLRQNDLVRTSAGASAEIRFFDGTVVEVRPDSLITIEESLEDPMTRARKVSFDVSSGEVNFETGRHETAVSSAEVGTPTARVYQGAGAAGGVRVATTGASDVRQFRGDGRVETRGGETIRLASNEGLSVDASGAAAGKLRLPPSPLLLAPPHQAEISYPDPARATTLLAWRPVEGAEEYRVELDLTPAFNRPLVDQHTADSSVEVKGLEIGKYYWRVAAVGGSAAAEGAFSEYAGFSVTRPSGAPAPGEPPPLRVDVLDVRGNILQIRGRTAAGARLTVNGQDVEVKDDGSFNEYLTLERGGRQEVLIRAIAADGASREERRTVVASE